MRYVRRGHLELFGQPRLLQYTVGGVTGFYLVVDGKTSIRDRAVPDLVIALAGTIVPAAGFPEELAKLRPEIDHSCRATIALRHPCDELNRHLAVRPFVQLDQLRDHYLELGEQLRIGVGFRN